VVGVLVIGVLSDRSLNLKIVKVVVVKDFSLLVY
jgi:hypothetical protein